MIKSKETGYSYEFKADDNKKNGHFLGKGSLANVYKGTVLNQNNKTVAIRVFDNQYKE